VTAGWFYHNLNETKVKIFLPEAYLSNYGRVDQQILTESIF